MTDCMWMEVLWLHYVNVGDEIQLYSLYHIYIV